ncbi:hypothetical protein TNCV_4275441 [Trichonephila clavipes]|nr:hypothetical protein TNCV_4275441 [Trichonephila clavipes]
MSAYADSTPYHQPALLYCDLSRTNARLFRVPLSLHTKTRRVSHSRLNRDSSVNSTWLNHVAPNLDVQQSIFFRPHGGVGSTGCRPLTYVHRAFPHEADYVLFGWTPFVMLPRATVFAAA